MPSKQQLSLLVLAAGMGSRYGGLKQIDEFGPSGQSLLEYAVYDAVQAGFDHIVLVIRKEFEQAFRDKFSAMLAAIPSYDFVYQLIEEGREKPWGTLDATLAARSVINNPFAVVNADDWYGTTSYQFIADKLLTILSNQSYLIGYILNNTLSDYGTVNRGVCTTNAQGYLKNVSERYAISHINNEINDRDGNLLQGDEIVSMNFWGFHQSFFGQAQGLLNQFKSYHKNDPKAEMTIPDAVDELIEKGTITTQVITSQDSWYGVTNPQDKPNVSLAFDEMHKIRKYPDKLR